MNSFFDPSHPLSNLFEPSLFEKKEGQQEFNTNFWSLSKGRFTILRPRESRKSSIMECRSWKQPKQKRALRLTESASEWTSLGRKYSLLLYGQRRGIYIYSAQCSSATVLRWNPLSWSWRRSFDLTQWTFNVWNRVHLNHLATNQSSIQLRATSREQKFQTKASTKQGWACRN